MTLTTEELAGTTEEATEKKSRANQAAAVTAGGGSGGAPAGNWRSVGDIASDLLENIKRRAGISRMVAGDHPVAEGRHTMAGGGRSAFVRVAERN